MLIHELLLKVQEEIGYLGKDSKNTMQNYKYRGIDDVYLTIHPLFVKHGILSRSEILRERQVELQKADGKYTYSRAYVIRYYFVATDGSEFWTDVAAEGVDTSDKASNKAMSAGHKYAILQAFTVPTESYDDPDASGDSITEAVVTDEAWLSDSSTMDELASRWVDVYKRHTGANRKFLAEIKDGMKANLS